jgi:Transmembrane domain of unknown function (DUF3566)
VDRRTNSPEGSGRASTTVVTSRAADEELAGHQPTEPMGSVESANGTVPEDTTDIAADATAVDAVPPLPAESGTTPPSAAKADKQPSATTVPPASFAWGVPDPPPQSPSSPARTFLRSDPDAKRGGLGAAATATSPGPAQTAAAEPASPPQQSAPKRSVRQAHLTVARIDPWSVMKFSFVVSLVAFVILFVAVTVLYGVLSGVGVFDSLQRVVSSVTSSQGSNGVNAKAWFSASRVLGYTALLGSLNIVLITAMSTIGSVIYNLTSRLVGGVEVTLRETE